MTRPRASRHLTRSSAGAILSFLAIALFAPRGAVAGCSHLVTSRSDRVPFASLLDPLTRDLAGSPDSSSEPRQPRRCTGAFCSGQPASPVVPAGTLEPRLASWAWYTPSSDGLSTDPSFLPAETRILRPLRRETDIFHPPRLLPSA
ncbi:MAG: hypothetical protein ACYC61_00625 [Isosphaeraceae bacterium]